MHAFDVDVDAWLAQFRDFRAHKPGAPASEIAQGRKQSRRGPAPRTDSGHVVPHPKMNETILPFGQVYDAA